MVLEHFLQECFEAEALGFIPEGTKPTGAAVRLQREITGLQVSMLGRQHH